jgi:hypothetical protein
MWQTVNPEIMFKCELGGGGGGARTEPRGA